MKENLPASTATATATEPAQPFRFRRNVYHKRRDTNGRKGWRQQPLGPPSPLRAARFAAIVTQEQLAIEAGMTATMVSLAERDLGTPEAVRALKAALKRIATRNRKGGRP